MATMTLTLIGMNNYDENLFSKLELPEPIVKEDFINNLLMRSGEFELLYPDADFMENAISLWGKKWKRTFEQWIKGQKAEWNPIENYDRYEDFKANYTLNVPESFNFGYDIIDEWARTEPEHPALLWCDDLGTRRTYSP